MSAGTNVIQAMIDEALLNTHTAFCAQVLSVNGDTADIQPLNLVKAVGGKQKKQEKLTGVPILQGARKFEKKKALSSQNGDPSHVHETEIWDIKKPEPGDTVYCVCADRDITDTKKGQFSLPVLGRHMISSAVIVGIF